MADGVNGHGTTNRDTVWFQIDAKTTETDN